METCTWKKVDGRYICMAKKCTHWSTGGLCSLGKVSLTCDNTDCKWNIKRIEGIYGCSNMDVHLDADGKCLGFKPIKTI